MKRYLLFSFSFILFSCAILPSGYPTTRFYVKNNSDEIVKFEAAVIKRSSITGPYEYSLPFTIAPKDSVLARQIGFKKDGKSPEKWFTKFTIKPHKNLRFKDPNKSENWVKHMVDGKPIYTFTITE